MQLRVFLAVIPVVFALASPTRAQQLADGTTLDRILPDIRAAHPGRLSDAQPWVDENGRTHYRIKWMTPEGRILYFDADARTGRYSSYSGAGEDQMRPPPQDRPRDNADNRPPANADNRPPPDDHGRRRNNWNGDLGPYGDDGGARPGDGRGPDGRGPNGHSGDQRSNGDWRGGHGEGDNGGGRHHGHGGF